MPLILAIEPDRRQASRVTALTRGSLNAQIVVADSTEHGVSALDGRVPDLILTSRLLSPKDEAGLRELDHAGVPVPTLMIPVLAAGSAHSQDRGGGLLARLRSRSSASGPDCDGCDPQVFASQIAEYLAEVHEAQEFRAQRIQNVQEVPRVQEVQEVQAVQDLLAGDEIAGEIAFDEPEIAPELELIAPTEILVAPEPEIFVAPEVVEPPAFVTDPEAVAEPMLVIEPEAVAESEVLEAYAPDLAYRQSPSDFDASVIDERPAPITPLEPSVLLRAAPVAQPQHDPFEWDDIVLDDDVEDQVIELSGEAIDLMKFVEELEASDFGTPAPSRAQVREPRASVVPQPAPAVAPMFKPVVAPEPEPLAAAAEDFLLDVPSAPRFALAQALPTYYAWPTLEGMAAEETAYVDMSEVVADFASALATVEDEPDSRRPSDPDSELWMPLSTAAAASWPRLGNSCSSRARPTQDEWGFFDPEQCGFSALVAKLDQSTR